MTTAWILGSVSLFATTVGALLIFLYLCNTPASSEAWQSPEVVNDPSILALVTKIEFEVHPDYARLLNEHPASRPTRIEVRARGTTFVGEKRYPRGGATPDAATFVTDDELSAKFVRNAEGYAGSL